MENKERQEVLLSKIFENRFFAVQGAMVNPFTSADYLNIKSFNEMKNRAVKAAMENDASFEIMSDIAMFIAEGAAMKTFTDYMKEVSQEWNKQNADKRHLMYEVIVNVSEASKKTD